MITWRQTVLSQFASSPRLVTLLDAIDSWLSPDANYELFYQQVMNLDTAGDYGLGVWARIVVVPTVVTIQQFQYFGFGEAGDRVGFDQGSFGDFYLTTTANFQLTGEVLRKFIYAKAAFNITDGSIPAINAILMTLFPGRGNAYVTDGGNSITAPVVLGFGEPGDRVGFDQGPFSDYVEPPSADDNMTLTYVFTFPIYQYEAAMAQSGVLPKPTGVKARWSFTGGFID